MKRIATFALVLLISEHLAASTQLDVHHAAQLPEPQAIQILQQLAQQGQGASQLQLAEFYSNQNNEQALQQAYAWALMARDNNMPTTELFRALRQKVKGKREAKALYRQLNAEYGQAALKASLYPEFLPTPAQQLWPKAINQARFQQAEQKLLKQFKREVKHGWGIALLTVDWAGGVTNVRMLAGNPKRPLETNLAKTLTLGNNNTPLLFEPLSADAPMIERQFSYVFTFSNKEPTLTANEIQTLRQQAAAGISSSQLAWVILSEDQVTDADYTAHIQLLKAAINNDIDAQLNIANCLLTGVVCIKAPEKATRWLEIADRSGSLTAKRQLAQINRDLSTLKQMAMEGDVVALHHVIQLLQASPKSDNHKLAVKLLRLTQLLPTPEPSLFESLARSQTLPID